MKTHRAWWIPIIALVAGSGCQQAVYDAELAKRQERIHSWWNDYVAREQGRPANIEMLDKTSRDLQALYAERLNATYKTLQDKYRRDNRRWQERGPLRREQIRQQLEGTPENIPDVWAKMVY